MRRRKGEYFPKFDSLCQLLKCLGCVRCDSGAAWNARMRVVRLRGEAGRLPKWAGFDMRPKGEVT